MGAPVPAFLHLILFVMCIGAVIGGYKLFKSNLAKRGEVHTARQFVLADFGITVIMIAVVVGIYSLYQGITKLFL